MLEETYIKEFDKVNEKIIISFKGDKKDIYELRDYARIINSVHHEAAENYYRGFKKNEEKEADNVGNFLENAYDELEYPFDHVNEAYNEYADMWLHNDKSELCDIINDIMMEEEEEDLVNHPSHYTGHGMECILEMVMLYGFEEVMSFCKLNAHKYRKRALDKGGRIDMDKSDWYINTYQDLYYAIETGMTPLEYILSKSN